SGLGSRAMARPYATLAFLGLRWRFKGPIKIGDTIKVRMKVTAKRDTSKPDRGIVTVQRHVLNQRGEVVQEGDTELMIERRKERRRMPVYFEDLKVGYGFEPPGRTITEADVVGYAALSGDHASLDFTAGEPDLPPAVPDLLVMAITSGLGFRAPEETPQILAFM